MIDLSKILADDESYPKHLIEEATILLEKIIGDNKLSEDSLFILAEHAIQLCDCSMDDEDRLEILMEDVNNFNNQGK